jgi:hypothetical protein
MISVEAVNVVDFEPRNGRNILVHRGQRRMASSRGTKKKPRKKTTGGGHAVDGRSARSILLDKMRDSPEFDDAIMLDEHPDLQKMSEVLLEYAEPLTEPLPANDDMAFRNAVAVAALCWNAALAPKHEREGILHEFISQTSRGEVLPAEESREILNFMIQRKLQLFKNNRRWILNYEIKSTKRDREVYVISSLERKQLKSLMPARSKPWWKRLLFWLK